MMDAELHERLRRNILAFKQLQGQAATVRTLLLPGITAFAVPEHAELLFQQQIMFEDRQALAEALEPLERWYRAHAVPAWRVPVLPGDRDTEALLSRAGYVPDLPLPAMALPLQPSPPPEVPAGLTLEHPDRLGAVLELNGRCYGSGFLSFLEVWRAPPLPSPQMSAVLVREEGQALACGLSFEQGDTAGIYLVATHEQARRRGLGAVVMRALHAGAHARGRTVAVLQASALGHHLYRQLGYRDLGAWTNWIKRVPAAAPA